LTSFPPKEARQGERRQSLLLRALYQTEKRRLTLDDVIALEPPVGLDLSLREPQRLRVRTPDLLERELTARGGIGAEVDERKGTFAQERVERVGPSVDLRLDQQGERKEEARRERVSLRRGGTSWGEKRGVDTLSSEDGLQRVERREEVMSVT
jgi:hypothetical protein